MFSIFQRSGNWKDFLRNSPVTSAIILINTLFFIVTVVVQKGINFSPTNLSMLGAIDGSLTSDPSELWRIFTAAFLHGDLMHYLSNMIIGVLTLSSALERILGSKKFTLVYFGSLILAGLAVVYFSDPGDVTIGASGAIFGVFGCLLWLSIYRKDLMSIRDAQSIRALIAINIIFTFLSPGISVPGHVGGIIAGFLLSFVIVRRNMFKVMH